MLAVLLLPAPPATAQQADSVEHSVVLGFGPEFDRDLDNKGSAHGATVTVEVTPIEEWLEIELGASFLSAAGRRATAVDLLFKKPFRLSSSAEFMIGAGPQLGRESRDGTRSSTKELELVLDFMFWPSRNVGWFVEPSYGYGLGQNRGDRSIGVSAGMLIGWQ